MAEFASFMPPLDISTEQLKMRKQNNDETPAKIKGKSNHADVELPLCQSHLG